MGEDLGIAAVVVLYKELLQETDTYLSFLQHLDIPILVYDNSPTAHEMPAKGNLTYMHDASNSGVSAAYNRAMIWASKISISHLLLLDSDSHFPSGALKLYQEHASEHPKEIILPSLSSEGHRISPFYFQGGKSHYGDDISYGEVTLGRILAINAGVLLPLDSIGALRYNESLPLDWSDVYFFRSLSKTDVKAQHIPLEIGHGLSEHGRASLESAKYRFSLYLRGIPIVASGWEERLLMFFWAKLKAMKLSLRYRTLWFVMQFFRRTHV